MKKLIWITWISLTIALGLYFYFKIFISQDKSELLIGETTYGHFQIEMECSACHTDPFGGPEILQDACTSCHAEELEQAHDSHPKKKFTDPREAYRLEIIDARYCVSCHTEHHQDKTHEMGVTLPEDYCYHCHKEVGDERESHKDLPFDSCASAGCHNYHDNRALYEAFLVDNANQPWLKAVANISPASYAKHAAVKYIGAASEAFSVKQALQQKQLPASEQHAWKLSGHAKVGLDCGSCHESKEQEWIEKPGITQCANCHQYETDSYTQGKHGMRLASNKYSVQDGITPSESALEFQTNSMNVQHGCNSCHASHSFETKKAATESCLTCHADDHSSAFFASPHGKLWQQELAGELEVGNGVSCATCHMPKVEKIINGNKVLAVNHNQNNNLKPNEKMIRSVCMDCHSLEFSIDALADPDLIKNNFSGTPGTHIESIDWSLKRIKK